MSGYIDSLNASIAEHQRIIDAGLPESAQAAQIIAGHQAEIARVQGGGGGGSGPSAVDVQAMINAALAEQAAAEKRRRDQEAKAILTSRLKEFGGMEPLIGDLDRLIREWGNNIEVILAKIPETETYQKRFKGLIDLRKKGVTDVRNESQYLQLESNYRQVFREAGMRDFLGADGTQDQFDAIAELVADYSVSVEEVRARVNDAARVIADTSNETLTALQEYYGIDTATLTEYVLDPVRTQNKINTIANATLLGGAAGTQGLNINRDAAESVAAMAGDNDANIGQFTREFTSAAALRDATARLASLEGTDLTDSEAVLSAMDLDANAKKKTRGLQSRERARFGGSTGVNSSSLSTNRG